MRKELVFGLSLMAILIAVTMWIMPSPSAMTSGHLGLLMLSLVVVAIMLGFPTAFTLMGMGTLFAFLAYRSVNPDLAVQQTLDLMVQRTYAVMTNEVLISIPLFVFMGYLVERANLIERLFKSLHLAMSFVPGSLAVATLATCALFATATGIVGAVVTLMGLLAFPAMLRSGYDIKLSAGAITAGGCLGILIPPSVMLILYGATAGVSVVQLYAGAFFPGLMLAGLYIGYVIIRAKLNPALAPMPPESELHVSLPAFAESLKRSTGSRLAIPGLAAAFGGPRLREAPRGVVAKNLFIALMPAILFAAGMGVIHRVLTEPDYVYQGELREIGEADDGPGVEGGSATGLSEPPGEEASSGLQEPPAVGLQEPLAEGAQGAAPTEAIRELRAEEVQEPPGHGAQQSAAGGQGAAPREQEAQQTGLSEPPGAEKASPATTQSGEIAAVPAVPEAPPRKPTPRPFWIVLALGVAALAFHYSIHTFERLEVFKMLLGSFFPLASLILAVLGSIIFGWATPTEAAALGATGGLLLTGAYRQFKWSVLRESVFLTAKTTAMVCWLFVGSSIFSAAFALLGGQAIIEHWVLGLSLSPVEFMLLAQFIIFVLGWPLEWTEIIVIFMPIFIPLLGHFEIDPLFFGLLVALNLQTAFLSPPVAMAAFYLKGVAPEHVSLNQIFAGMMPFMAIQVLALFVLYVFPQIGLWLPSILYQ
ncbi:MAG TPA: TRAP transporter large permease subunit [Anaeromyxobacteraceae bacterium]|nr:TRAP transporter large permease subunit [Anaeromyxobacteraceae bacterium]